MELKLPEFVKMILQNFQSGGFEIYIVGGAVRDLLMGREVKDWDFTTNAAPEEILKIFPDGFYDNQFGTVGVIDAEKNVYEITTFRKEIGYSDKRHPDKVEWGKSLEEDLSRRDFTINAIALGLEHRTENIVQRNKHPMHYALCTMHLIDPFSGQEDLKAKIVRAVGDPNERFSEDALRMIRAIRIATEIGFSIEPETFDAIKENASLIDKIAQERVKEELFRILKSDLPANGFNLLLESGLLEKIIPELIKGYGLSQAKHHIYDVWTHSLLSLKFTPSCDPVVRFATLLHDVGKPVVVRGDGEKRTFYNHEVAGARITAQIADRLRFSKKEKEKLVTLVRWHQFSVDERQTDSAIRRFIKNAGIENLQDMIDLRVGDRLGGGAKETSWRLEKYKKRLVEVQQQPFSVKDLKVDGNDVMKTLNITSGPKVGEILENLFKEVEEGKLKNEKEILLERIKKLSK